jgi:hypothetical protein
MRTVFAEKSTETLEKWIGADLIERTFAATLSANFAANT